ncbi:hypothetical protein VUJ46_07440 [Chryseobacterium sp. MYb264]|uniref:hypothetical protein n=1 Tax=Chryseobacterium sp. MYb264 TaxID=2745153 RepID=UPI002E105DEE|nr:hypothetical protein VUJ46_07440 [Chryseobacterium sp. MYb264]
MAAAPCEISFKIDYTSSVPVTSTNSSASYVISGSGYPANETNIDPSQEITLPVIQNSGDYDLKVKLTVEGVEATSTGSFKIGDCNNGEVRTIFYNHARRDGNPNDPVSKVNFLIRKNGEEVVLSEVPNVEYDNPIEKWKSFEAKVGDRIEFITDLINSGSSGKTMGGMFTCRTTGKDGTVNGGSPTASDFKLLNSQDIGPDTRAQRIFAFLVEKKLNYALGTDFWL